MKERPILFSGPMVRAILDGRKTQTRRVVARRGWDGYVPGVHDPEKGIVPDPKLCYVKPGMRLWVRETFASEVPGCETRGGFSYRADHVDPRGDGPANPMRWKPSIHMPRSASRLLIEVVGVRAERLQDISEDDCDAEGYRFVPVGEQPEPDGYGWFRELWREINGRKSWAQNPWVWVVAFRKVEP